MWCRLLGENRFWVRYGLNYINNTESLSFKMLKQNGKVTKAASFLQLILDFLLRRKLMHWEDWKIRAKELNF